MAGRDRALGAGKERDGAGREAAERGRDVFERVDADGLEVAPEHGLHGAVPALVDRKLPGEAWAPVEAAGLEPVDDLALPLAEGRALQRLERHEATLDVLRLAPRGLRRLREFTLATAFGLQRRDELVHLPSRAFVLRACPRFLLVEAGERRFDVRRRKGTVFLRRALALADEAAQLVVHHFEPRTFRARCRGRLSQRMVESFPLLLPRRHGGFRCGQLGPRCLLGCACLLEPGPHLGERGFEFGGKLAVTHAVHVGVLHALRDLLELLPLARADLAGVIDRLLGARDLGADLVVATLHFRQHRRLGIVLLACAFDRRLHRALLRHGRLQGQLAFVQDRLPRGRLVLDLAQLQREQLGVCLSLLLLERLVATRRRRLSLQVSQLLLYLVAEVAQAREVLARLRNAALGLLALLLVPRDAGRLLQERTHVLGLGLDHAGDHVLLDDRVAARAQPGAKEQLGDVLAAAAHAVQEIRRLPVARDEALQRDLGVVRVLAAELAVGVVEHEFDRGGADRLARARAVEDHVRHRVAAQVLGGDLAHDPAHRIDDVRLAAAVRPHHADQVRRETDRGRVHERLETGQLDLGQAHPRYPGR